MMLPTVPKTSPKRGDGDRRSGSFRAGQLPARTSPANLYVCLVLFFGTLAVYLQVGRFEFINYDDPIDVSDNAHVKKGLTLESLVWATTSGEAANWIPISRLSHVLDCQLFGLRSGFHHLTNVLFHALATLMLFAFLHRATLARGRSAVVAALFALHPLHVESVAWIAERKDVLSAFFWFLTLWAYVDYTGHIGPGRKRRYLLTLTAFGLGLMAKPMMVTLPFVLLLLDVWPLRRLRFADGPSEIADKARVGGLLWEKAAFFALAAATAAITYSVQRKAGAVLALSAVPIGLRIENALVSYVVYIAKTLYPAGLAVFYPYPAALPGWQVLLTALAILALSVLFLRLVRQHPYLTVGWFWFLGTLVPVIGFVQAGLQARADRYMYLPMTGLAIVLSWGGAAVLERFPAAKPAVGVAAVAACITLAALSWNQVRYWKNSESLFRHAVAVTQSNYLAHYQLGLTLANLPGRLPEAILQYEEAVRIKPDYPEALNDLGVALSKTPGQLPQAISRYREAVRLRPRYAAAHNNLGSALSKISGGLPKAAAEFQAALRLDPENAVAHNNLGGAFAKMGRVQESISECQAALRINPDYAAAHNNLGNILSELPGRLPDAISHYREAVRIEPDYSAAHNNLGTALSEIPGGLPEAIGEYQSALRIMPDDAEAHNNLGSALFRIGGRLPEAIAEFESALRLKPDYADAHYNLGVALFRMPGHSPDAIAHLQAALKLRPDPRLRSIVDQLRSRM